MGAVKPGGLDKGWCSQETFLVVTTGRHAAGIWVVETRDAAKSPTISRMPFPHQKE